MSAKQTLAAKNGRKKIPVCPFSATVETFLQKHDSEYQQFAAVSWS